jgi:hypothetical protein
MITPGKESNGIKLYMKTQPRRASQARVEEAVRFPEELRSFPAFRSFVRAKRADRSGAQVLG